MRIKTGEGEQETPSGQEKNEKQIVFYWQCGVPFPNDPSFFLPADAPVSLTETATAHSDLFRHMPLHKAFHSFNSAEETLDGTP